MVRLAARELLEIFAFGEGTLNIIVREIGERIAPRIGPGSRFIEIDDFGDDGRTGDFFRGQAIRYGGRRAGFNAEFSPVEPQKCNQHTRRQDGDNGGNQRDDGNAFAGLRHQAGGGLVRLPALFRLIQLLNEHVVREKAFGRLLGQHPADDLGGVILHGRIIGLEIEGRGAGVQGQNFRSGLGVERRAPGQGVKQRGAQGVHVAVKIFRQAAQFFRGDVVGSTPDHIRPGPRGFVLGAGQTEVHQLGHSFVVEQDVAGFDIAVQHLALVRRPQPTGDPGADGEHIRFR